MDPNATLDSARKALATYRAALNSEDEGMGADDLAEAFESLDTWLSNGGFLPQDWANGR